MSWRLITLTLFLALGISAWAGRQMGLWLVVHAPLSLPETNQPHSSSLLPSVDADGQPYVEQPPQPRVDGTFGVPNKPANTKWSVTTLSLFDIPRDPSVQVSKANPVSSSTKIDAVPGAFLPSGVSDINMLDLSEADERSKETLPNASSASTNPSLVSQSSKESTEKINKNIAPGFASDKTISSVQSSPMPRAKSTPWQNQLRFELLQCERMNFFNRSSCSRKARQQYCESHHAWGRIPECPR